MFNRCWRWRVLLARRADGALSASQWGSLQDHLVSCASCRKLAEADAALQSQFNYYVPGFSQDAAAAFDDRVVSAVRAARWRTLPQPSWFSRLWNRMQPRLRTLPLAFLGQIGGGAVLAVSLTSFFLVPALHAHPPVSVRAARMLDTQTLEHGEASVPMESLLQTPTPRAALLWTTPQPGSRHRSAPRASVRTPEHDALPAQPLPSSPEVPSVAPRHPRSSALPNTKAYG